MWEASSVDFVSNPSTDVSTHRWSASKLKHLGRKNKMSSLPFWTPNPVMKKHQFRLILIRGLVKKEREDDDLIGVILELISPPTDGESVYPGGCSVTVRVVNRVYDDHTHDIVSVETATLREKHLQVSFPELIPPAILDDPGFVRIEDMSVLLEVTIQTGVNVAAERVNRTVSSMWTTLSKSVGKFLQKASQALSDAREEYGVRAGKKWEDDNEAEVEMKNLPWEHAPDTWVGREKEWRYLIAELIVGDEGTFRYGPNRGFSKDEQALLLQCGLNQRLITNTHARFDYEHDVHEGLLSLPAMRQQRYNLVPGKIKEEVFWANYFWKIAALSLCKNDEQVRLLLTVLNAPPAVKPRDISSIRTVDEETVISHVKDAQEAADMLIEYLTDATPDGDLLLEAAAAACEGHAKQLDGYFKRVDLSESTLKITGAVLKRLRERLAEYLELKEGKRLNPATDEHDTPVGTITSGGETTGNGDDDDNEMVKGIHPPLSGSSPTSQSMGKAHEKAAVLNAESVDERVKDGASEVPGTSSQEKATHTRKSPSEVVGCKLDFPLMPWEEDDEKK